MDTHAQLKHLQRELHQALNELTHADAEVDSAQKAYDKALAEWEAKNPELVANKTRATQGKADAKKRIETLREEAKGLLGESFIDNLPEGFNQKRSKVVVYDKQGFTRIAHQYFPFLLVLDDKEVQRFFSTQAEEAADGALVLPENIRAFAAVEVVYQPKVEISEAKLSKLNLEPETEETKAMSAAVTEVVETLAVKPAWIPPANATAFLTAPSNDLLMLDNFSSEDESLPINEAINPDLWDEALEEIDAAPSIPLSRYGAIPPTEKINF